MNIQITPITERLGRRNDITVRNVLADGEVIGTVSRVPFSKNWQLKVNASDWVTAVDATLDQLPAAIALLIDTGVVPLTVNDAVMAEIEKLEAAIATHEAELADLRELVEIRREKLIG